MERNSWITFLRIVLIEADNALLPDFDIYLFGSALTRDDPQDLDILIVYDGHEVSTYDAIHIRREVKRLIQTRSRLQKVDVCLLSHDELITSDFAARERAVKIFPIDVTPVLVPGSHPSH